MTRIESFASEVAYLARGDDDEPLDKHFVTGFCTALPRLALADGDWTKVLSFLDCIDYLGPYTADPFNADSPEVDPRPGADPRSAPQHYGPPR